jgi:hypothetical protein
MKIKLNHAANGSTLLTTETQARIHQLKPGVDWHADHLRVSATGDEASPLRTPVSEFGFSLRLFQNCSSRREEAPYSLKSFKFEPRYLGCYGVLKEPRLRLPNFPQPVAPAQAQAGIRKKTARGFARLQISFHRLRAQRAGKLLQISGRIRFLQRLPRPGEPVGDAKFGGDVLVAGFAQK